MSTVCSRAAGTLSGGPLRRKEALLAHQHLLVQSAAREKILHSALALADALRATLGLNSTCVLIEKKWGRPIVCNDGVTIAKAFELEDPEENSRRAGHPAGSGAYRRPGRRRDHDIDPAGCGYFRGRCEEYRGRR